MTESQAQSLATAAPIVGVVAFVVPHAISNGVAAAPGISLSVLAGLIAAFLLSGLASFAPDVAGGLAVIMIVSVVLSFPWELVPLVR